MPKRDIKHAMELAAVLAQEASYIQNSKDVRPAYYGEPSPHLHVCHALDLLRIGAGVASRAVRMCNGNGWAQWGQWTEADGAKRDRMDAKAKEKAQAIASAYCATVELGGDPRGFTMRLHLKSGRKNGWGEGWGVA